MAVVQLIHKTNKKLKIKMVSRDRRDRIYSATKSKEIRNKILAQVNSLLLANTP